MGLIEKLLISVYRNLEGVWPSTISSPGCHCRPRQVRFTASKWPLRFRGYQPVLI